MKIQQRLSAIAVYFCLTSLKMNDFSLVSNDNFSSSSLCLLCLVVALSTALPREVWHHVLYTISADGCLLGSPQHVHVFPVLGSLKWSPELWMCLPSAEQRRRYTFLDLLAMLAQPSTLLAHVPLVHQDPQMHFCRASAHPVSPQSTLMDGVVPPQVQDLFPSVECHGIHWELLPLKLPTMRCQPEELEPEHPYLHPPLLYPGL